MAYHSALRPELTVEGELSEFQRSGSVAFEWDVTRGVHPYFWMADALYTEPSWRDGYDRFLERAGQPGTSTFPEYLNVLRDVIATLRIPSYVVMGKHMLKALRPPRAAPIAVHGYGGFVGVWNAECPPDGMDVGTLVEYVCARHRTVLDPCCGYGNVAATARRFICSDVNRKCVYHVAATHMGYNK